MTEIAQSVVAAAVALALGPPVVVHGEVHMLPVVQASPLDVSLGEAEPQRSWAWVVHTAVCIEGMGSKRTHVRVYHAPFAMGETLLIANTEQRDELKQTNTHQSRRLECCRGYNLLQRQRTWATAVLL